MSEGKHTPGPWAVNEDGWKVESKNEHGWINDGWIVCSTHGPDAKGNASLIAAAPELLEALKMVAQHGRIDNSEHRMNVVGAAISKAEGRS